MAPSGSRPSRTVRDAAARDLKFQLLAGELRRGIMAGEWPPGAKLPTESRLAEETGLSLTTVRRAFDELVQQRLVVRRQGAGTFVADPERTEPRLRKTIGVLVPDAQVYFPRVLQGIEEALSSAGVRMQLATHHYDLDEEARDLAFLLEGDVDGLLIVPTLQGLPDPRQRLDELMSLRIPAVMVERRILDGGPDNRVEHVCSDHPGGAYDAVNHLARLGHRRIALLGRSNNPTIEGVLRGYEFAVRDLGLDQVEVRTAPQGEWTPDQAGRFVDSLVSDGVGAALVFGDREATFIQGAAHRRGLRVPGDLALVSYDDETADLAEVPLTAVAPPKFRVGRMAAEVLLRRLKEGDACPLHQVVLRPRIVIRDSCGARLDGGVV